MGRSSCMAQLCEGIKCFGKSIYQGARMIMTRRKFIWLPIGYSLALYGHRYLENGVIPIIAEGLFRCPKYSQIMIAGSNLGELLGAFTVFVFGDGVPTPIPWLRADAVMLLLVWVLPFYMSWDRSAVSFFLIC